MHAPVLVTPPATKPIRLEETKLHLHVDGDDEDALIEGLIDAATGYLDGWTGILGRALVAQTWRQDFDRFERCLRLPLFPVMSIVSITARDAAGDTAAIDDANFTLEQDARGCLVRFADAYAGPGSLYEIRAIAVTYEAGYPDAEPEEGEEQGASTVPAPIRQAMLLLVGHWFQNREGVAAEAPAELPLGVKALLAPWRRVGL